MTFAPRNLTCLAWNLYQTQSFDILHLTFLGFPPADTTSCENSLMISLSHMFICHLSQVYGIKRSKTVVCACIRSVLWSGPPYCHRSWAKWGKWRKKKEIKARSKRWTIPRGNLVIDKIFVPSFPLFYAHFLSSLAVFEASILSPSVMSHDRYWNCWRLRKFVT